MQLHERYRPKVWADVVGQPKALERLEALRSRGLGGRAYWISGASGVGKTTVARLLAAEIADEWLTEELERVATHTGPLGRPRALHVNARIRPRRPSLHRQ